MFFPTLYPDNDLTITDLCLMHRLDKGDFERSLADWAKEFSLHDTMGYCRTYDRLMASAKRERINLLEIGCADQRFVFGSCRMWRSYFTKASIYTLDNLCSFPAAPVIEMARALTGIGVNFIHGDQGDPAILEEAKLAGAPFRFVIDDGSHYPIDIRVSFDHLWPALERGGVYFIEDVGVGMDLFSHENSEILDWAKHYPQSMGGKVEVIRSTSSRYEIYLLAITKE